MKGDSNILEGLFAQVLDELQRREMLLSDKISTLEEKIAVLEEQLARLQENTYIPGDGQVIAEEEPVTVDTDLKHFGDEPVTVEEEIEIEFEFEDPIVEMVEDIVEEEVLEDGAFEEGEPVGKGDVEIIEVDESEETVEMQERISVMEKARPDWFDWEVDIPGPYIEDIWDGIGLNDRMLFLNDLFGGDEESFNETVSCLNEVESLVGAMEYIRGRYPGWNEESDEVYRFYMTVRRRFNKQK